MPKRSARPPLVSSVNMSADQGRLEAGIAAMEAQREVLGHGVVDAALTGLHAKLAALRNAGGGEGQVPR